MVAYYRFPFIDRVKKTLQLFATRNGQFEVKIKKIYDLVLEKDIFFVETRTGSSFHLRLPPFCFFTFRLNRRCTAERCFVVQLQVVGTEVNEYKNIVGVCICREIFNTY